LTVRSLVVERRGARLHADVIERAPAGAPAVVFVQGTGLPGAGWGPQVDGAAGGAGSAADAGSDADAGSAAGAGSAADRGSHAGVAAPSPGRGLADDHRCLTFDHRGIGRSRPAGDAVDVPTLAADTLALMDAAGMDDVHLVGHSLGSLVCLQVAATAPERVRSLALLCAFAVGADATRLTPWLAWVGARMTLGTRASRRRGFLAMIYPPEALAGGDADAVARRLEPYFGGDLAVRPPGVAAQLEAMRAFDARPLLPRLAGVPTLVLSAARDRVAPPALGRALADGIPGARYREVAGAAHGVVLQKPREVNEALRSHVRSAEASNPP
jgi:pimeloyl-ACP methyl ester carboxylesterase